MRRGAAGARGAPTRLPFTPMRILVVSTLYPPVAFGGYEVECSGVVERLREHHDVLVLTCDWTREHRRARPTCGAS